LPEQTPAPAVTDADPGGDAEELLRLVARLPRRNVSPSASLSQ